MNNEKSINFGELMLDELGLYNDQDGLVYDQETDSPIRMNGKNLVYPYIPEVTINKRTDMLFDPLNNPTLSKYLLGFYIDNRMSEEVSQFFTRQDTLDKDKSAVVLKSGDTVVVESGVYYSDQIKYADAIMRMNGDPNPNLSEYDAPIERRTKKGRR